MLKVLFVCMGNICRSPVAEGVFQRMLEEADLSRKIAVDSAGTHSYHIGSQPDTRSQSTARLRDIDLSNLRARQIDKADFSEFDYILAMDKTNYSDIMYHAENVGNYKAKVMLMTDLLKVNNFPDGVPDPYSYGKDQFELVIDILMETCETLLDMIIKENKL